MTQVYQPGMLSFTSPEPAPLDPVVAPEPPTEMLAMPILSITAIAKVVDAHDVPRAMQIQTKSHLVATGTWTWEQLRDYVIGQIHQRWGAQPRDLLRESGIFKGFVARWGESAGPIARAAFEVHGGMWKGAPIAVSRFAKGSDPWFAEIIAQNL